MSDESNKLVRQSHEIAPAEDFARKIEERLRAEPVPVDRECLYAFKYEKGVISRCKKLEPHNEHQNGTVFWKEICQSVSPDGDPCVYQLEHVGDHGNGRDATWAPQAIAPVGEPDDFAVIGSMLQASPAFQQMLARRAAASRPIMQRVPLQKARSFQLGFGPEKVPPGTTRTVTVRPQIMFRGEKLLVSDPELTIVSVFVGAKKQPLEKVSAAFFSPESLGNAMPPLDTAQPGIDISIVVANYTSVERTFNVALIGKGIG